MSRRSLEDAGLPLFTAPERCPPPGRVEPDLAVAARATDRPFRVEGERVLAAGLERGSLTSIRIDGEEVIGRLEAGAGVVANVVSSPGRIRRERVGPGGSTEETVLVAPALPLLVLHTAPAAGPLTLRAFPGHATVRHHAVGGAVTLAADAGERVLGLVLVGEGGPWTVGTDEHEGVVLTLGASPAPRTLLVAFGTPEAVRTAFRGAGHLAGHEVRAVGRPGHDAISLATGARDLDDGVAWMVSRLRHGILHAESAPTGEGPGAGRQWFWAGLGSVAVGDGDGAMRCVRALERVGDGAAAAFLAGRIALMTGEVGAARERMPSLLEGAGAGGDPALDRLARRTVADALRYAASDDALARLREGDGPRTEVTTTGRRLPTVGSPTPAQTTGSWLTAMFDAGAGPAAHPTPTVVGESLPEPLRDEVATGLGAWADFSRDPDLAWTTWRALVQEGMSEGRHGAGTWDPVLAPPALTGVVLAAMTHGWLGIFPDAPVGRLVVSPRLPGHLRAFAVHGIPAGDARVALTYERSGTTHAFTFEVEHGRMPPSMVFETTVPHDVARVLLDGNPVEPDTSRSEAGTTVRLQTPLDAPRTLTIEGG
jgi:hypothetical protein